MEKKKDETLISKWRYYERASICDHRWLDEQSVGRQG